MFKNDERSAVEIQSFNARVRDLPSLIELDEMELEATMGGLVHGCDRLSCGAYCTPVQPEPYR